MLVSDLMTPAWLLRAPTALADPMVGSGTFAIEAAHMATRTAPGSFRRLVQPLWQAVPLGIPAGWLFGSSGQRATPEQVMAAWMLAYLVPSCLVPLCREEGQTLREKPAPRRFWPFTRWPEFDRRAWEEAQQQAADLRVPGRVQIWGNDIHTGALSLALRDCSEAGVRELVRLHHGDARTWRLPHAPQLVVANPPWGNRLLGGTDDEAVFAGSSSRATWSPARSSRAEAEELQETWFGLSVFLKEQCGGATAAILCGNPEASKALRLKTAVRHPVGIGGVDCRLLVYGIKGRRGGDGPPTFVPDAGMTPP